MSEATHDLWPDVVDVTSVVPPVIVLKEQASLLGERTKGLVRAEVESTEQAAEQIEKYLDDVLPVESRVVYSHTLYLVAPALDNYRYSLLSVTHDFLPYPCDARFHPRQEDDFPRHIPNPMELVEWLAHRLRRTETVRLIQALIARVQQLGEPGR